MSCISVASDVWFANDLTRNTKLLVVAYITHRIRPSRKFLILSETGIGVPNSIKFICRSIHSDELIYTAYCGVYSSSTFSMLRRLTVSVKAGAAPTFVCYNCTWVGNTVQALGFGFSKCIREFVTLHFQVRLIDMHHKIAGAVGTLWINLWSSISFPLPFDSHLVARLPQKSYTFSWAGCSRTECPSFHWLCPVPIHEEILFT